MSAQAQQKYLMPEEYLAIERQSAEKSEYVDGVMYVMAGGSPNHSLIGGNVLTELNTQLKRSPCRVFNSDLKVCVPSKRKYFYPDVTVVCGAPQFDDDQDVLLNPLLLIEVLSDSTAGYDRARKFLYYQEIESFSEYLLLSQDEFVVEHYVKQPNGSWIYTVARGEEQSVELTTINCRLQLRDIYAKVLA
ncbi:MAG: Uma2 family endonuclease [Acidobacteria bacterium]|nr:Uma2 family endonuclease [Acidobacteriota bacterium]